MNEASARITNPTGLHARPAVKLAQLASQFDASIQLRVGDGDWVKANRARNLMKLKARADSTLYFRAEGDQAQAALQALVDFVERDFDEHDPQPSALQSAPPPIDPSLYRGAAVYTAEVASQGLAQGIVYCPDQRPVRSREQQPPTPERQRLRDAIDQASKQLAELAQRSSAMGADIITFQRSLLADGEFIEAIHQTIADGKPAAQAWRQGLDREVADYESAADPMFRARAADLRDLRDRVLAALTGECSAEALPDNAIVVVEEMTPSRFLELNWQKLAGAVMFQGSQAGHTAMLARAQSVPLLIKLQAEIDAMADIDGREAILDAESGRLILSPDTASRNRYRSRAAARQSRIRLERQFLHRPARSADGRSLTVYINVDDPSGLDAVDPEHCDGVGLTRTEFLFHERHLPDEDSQYAVYRQLLEWACDRPVTVRTLDAGGDKPLPGLPQVEQSNPFLGQRGLRLSLAHPDIFAVQLRALARAAVHGRLKVMLPMVTLAAELDAARELLQRQVDALLAEGEHAALPALGIMVEVPAAALTIGDFDADFFSIGSNDLIQYTLAAGRDCAAVGELQQPLHPAVLELIARVVEHGRNKGLEVSLCGEMAADPDCLQALLSTGLRALSVPPSALGRVKAALNDIKVN